MSVGRAGGATQPSVPTDILGGLTASKRPGTHAIRVQLASPTPTVISASGVSLKVVLQSGTTPRMKGLVKHMRRRPPTRRRTTWLSFTGIMLPTSLKG